MHTKTSVAYTITPTGVLMFVNGKQFVVGDDHPNFAKIKTALKNKQHDGLEQLADVRSTVQTFVAGAGQTGFQLVGDCINLDGIPFTREVTGKVLAMINAGHNADPLYAFLRKVRSNPSKTAQDELLLFCVANEFMIHEDGDIIAYKSVRGDYTDIYSGKVKNTVGAVLTMDRGQVDDNRERTCSTGYHFAAYKYATTWHGRSDARLMVMKINPADVVSIPSDYENQKARTCRYEIIAEIPHSARLPKQEVYTTADITACDSCTPRPSVSPKVTTTATNAAKVTRVQEMQRKEAVIRDLQDQLRKHRKTAWARRGNAWYESESKLENRIEKIREEIDAL